MTKVGWIGVGAMGAPMACRLAEAGFEVTAFDTDAARVVALATSGVAAASSVSEAARGADVLALMIATPEQAERVLFGEDPAAEALGAGSSVLLMATVGPDAARRLAEALATRDISLVDAPVSGGVGRAASGDLLAMVAAAGLPAVRPLLETLASTINVVGPNVGDGQKVKLVNQLLCGVHIAVAAEALAFAEALGLNAAAVLDVIGKGAAASFMLADRGPRMTSSSYDDVRSALDIFVKDMGLVLDAARGATYAAPLASSAQLLYLAGRRGGLGRLDDSSVIEVLRQRAGLPET